jgi:AhpC/TSA antioxidant enzyme
VQRELEGRDVRLVAVVPGTPEQARRLRDARSLRWLLLCDPSFETHRRLGLRRASARETWLASAVWRSYLRLALRGRLPRRPEQDVRWLGADFVLDRDGGVRFEQRSRHPADYASPGAIVVAVRTADIQSP